MVGKTRLALEAARREGVPVEVECATLAEVGGPLADESVDDLIRICGRDPDLHAAEHVVVELLGEPLQFVGIELRQFLWRRSGGCRTCFGLLHHEHQQHDQRAHRADQHGEKWEQRHTGLLSPNRRASHAARPRVPSTLRVFADALEQVRRTNRPALIEAKTLRLRGHAAYDTCDYLQPGESEAFFARDPLPELLLREEQERRGPEDPVVRALAINVDERLAAVREALAGLDGDWSAESLEAALRRLDLVRTRATTASATTAFPCTFGGAASRKADCRNTGTVHNGYVSSFGHPGFLRTRHANRPSACRRCPTTHGNARCAR